MGKKLKRTKQRAVAGVLGKALTRRSRGVCELCASRDQSLVYELAPFPPEPELTRSLMACAQCRGWLDHREKMDGKPHFLSRAVWDDEPAVQLAAARLLLLMDHEKHPWALDALEAVHVNPATGEFV